MTIKAVIFDLGGVLVRTEDLTSRERLAARLGMTSNQLEKLVFASETGLRAQRGEISLQEHWEAVVTQVGLTPEDIPAFQKDFWAGDVVDLDLINYIRSLRGPYRTGLLSNAFSDLRQMVTQRWKFADAFDEMIISSEVGVTKPEARIYQIALDRLSTAPSEAVFLDDFKHNVEGARAVGMHAIHFQDPEQTRIQLEQLLDDSKG